MAGNEDRRADVILGAKTGDYTKNLQGARKETDALATSVDKLAQKLDGLQKRAGRKLALFGGGIVAGTGAGIVGITKEAAQFEKQLETLSASAAIGNKSLEGMTRSVTTLTRQFPVARGEAVALVTTLDNLGVRGTRNLTSLSQTFVKLGAASGESVAGLATSMVTLGRQMDTLQAGTMNQFANSLLVVSRQAGVSASGVLNFASAIAPAARMAGMGEQAVLGISTAFTRAGADGYAAANTFNQVINDITRQIVTGSPEIAKYANLIGVTSDTLRSMDKGEAITQIFEAINAQGPDAIKTLDRLGYDGVRALRSIQAVSQGGGLRQAIATATNAYGSTSALDKGSEAALDGLIDTLSRTSNEFQELATVAGGPFLGAITPVAEVFERMLSAANGLLRPLAALGPLMGMVIGGGALGLGASMMTARVSSMVAAARIVGGGTGTVLRQGFAAGRWMAGGAEPDARAMAAADRFTGGQMRWWQSAPYSLGAGIGQALGPGVVRTGPGLISRTLGRPLDLAAGFANAQAEWYRNSNRPYEMRTSPILSGMGTAGGMLRGAAVAAVADPRAFIAGLRSPATEGGLGPVQARRLELSRQILERGGALPDATLAKLREQTAANVAATAANVGAQRGAAAAAGSLTASFVRLRMASLGAMAGGAVGLAGRGIGAGLRGLAGLAGMNPVAAGLVGAGVLGYTGYQWSRESSRMGTPDFAPIDKYNAALGIASSELGTFTSAIKQATTALPRPSSMESLREVSPDVISLAGQARRRLTNPIFRDLDSRGGRAAFMQMMGITDPRQLQLIQADITQANSARAASRATATYLDRVGMNQAPDYAALIRDLDRKQGQGFKGTFGVADPTVERVLAASFASIRGQYGRDANQYNGVYATQRGVDQARGLLGAALGSSLEMDPSRSRVIGGRTATTAVRGFENAFLEKRRTGFSAASFAKDTAGMSDEEAADYFFTEFLANNSNQAVRRQVRGWARQGVELGGSTPAVLEQLRRQEDSAYRRSVLGVGGLGVAALAEGGAIQRAVTRPGDINAQYEGIQAMLSSAREIGTTFGGLKGSFSETDAQLQRMKAAVQDVNDPLYQMAANAQAFNTAQRQVAMGDTNRAGRMGYVVENYRSVMAGPRNAPDFQGRATDAIAELQAQKDAYEDYVRGLISAQKSFSIQMRRGEEDMARTIGRTNADFWRSMRQGEEDFYRSRARSQRDFTISMTRQAEDAAKSIYNPFQRVQLQFTTSLGTTMENLKTQNRFIVRQRANLDELRRLGLSRQAIDVMGLADPTNAQQTGRMTEELANNPELAARFNRQARRRQRATTDLIQNPDNASYRRQIEDYRRGMADMASDFERMRERAVSSHNRNLGRMREDYDTQMNRAKEDLARMGEEIFGNFGELMEVAVRKIAKNLGPLGDKIIKELDKIKRENPELFADYEDIAAGTVGVKNQIDSAVRSTAPRGAVTWSAAADLRTAGKGTPTGGTGGATSVIDNSTNFTGDITVKAEDTRTIQRELEEKARLRRLTRRTGP